ncbi:cold-shock protein [Flexithrix dorotheae]|uniref:cold-shock protein n=1 Tax=Flexithrix dorotheae TaxID=70993 RepID=UPI00036C98DF|nr:cold shock domain-containing protein [Flexithrix dorotheae]|eukprot:TRINITY_DN112727_c0_g1_i1.p1 TRINITY_DN112727_c0_g1~~TRINITY_DN112727_c0_g1_i1.p1  ORF type:complete len:146 (-),score=10.55 TRINITY_DN112727_c0_g1_i1:68-505(-)
MAKSKETFGKKEKEKKRLKKKQDKQLRKEERKAAENVEMTVYVDEYGNLVETPPDPTKKKKIKAENIVIGVPKQEDIEDDHIRRGRVEFFNEQKGFGFIKDLDSREKYFVHVNGLLEEIKENNMVTFELEQGMKGMNAVKVKKSK